MTHDRRAWSFGRAVLARCGWVWRSGAWLPGHARSGRSCDSDRPHDSVGASARRASADVPAPGGLCQPCSGAQPAISSAGGGSSIAKPDRIELSHPRRNRSGGDFGFIAWLAAGTLAAILAVSAAGQFWGGHSGSSPPPENRSDRQNFDRSELTSPDDGLPWAFYAIPALIVFSAAAAGIGAARRDRIEHADWYAARSHLIAAPRIDYGVTGSPIVRRSRRHRTADENAQPNLCVRAAEKETVNASAKQVHRAQTVDAH